MTLVAAVLLTVGAIVFTLFVRERDLPKPDATTGYEHLEERKARIYENLRDLQFEYRVGKLSDEDYQRTKTSLQAELAGVMGEIDQAKAAQESPAGPASRPVAKEVSAAHPANGTSSPQATVCPSCGAQFATPMRFCGECGKAMVS
jgi:hypothetical protein